MRTSLHHVGLAMECEACGDDIDLPADLESGTGVCRQCGIAFLVDAPYPAARARRGA
ncbi:hypothetical protein [Aeromicrobium sp. A1-2]|uniref:hypothetical protein n=1 Tax=Aeromicrobium sp. A1-2 TaxID=2107713 RepID=UPI0013C2F69B|nr:hypothetical protein [Aeromicrobium sp. A1-2]